jgi:hypothetical protein
MPFNIMKDLDKDGADDPNPRTDETRKSSAWLGSMIFGTSFDMSKLQTPRESVAKLGNKLESALGELGSGLDKRVDAIASKNTYLKFTEGLNSRIGSLASFVAPKTSTVEKDNNQNINGRASEEEDKEEFVEFEDPNASSPSIEDVKVRESGSTKT